MAVGKAKPDDKYSKCGKGNGDSDNGCGVEECIKGGEDPKKRTGDYLMITGGIYTESEKTPVLHLRTDYYCGTGLGEDSVKEDGKDDGSGVFTQASGPVAIRLVRSDLSGTSYNFLRFVTDEFPGEAIGVGTKPEEARIKDELGWSIRYSFSGSCTTVNNQKP